MSRGRITCGGLLLAAVVAFGARPVPTAAQPAARVKWEYRVLTPKAIEELSGKEAGALVAGLNTLGDDGWELVAIEPGNVPPPVRLPRYVFKRPK